MESPQTTPAFHSITEDDGYYASAGPNPEKSTVETSFSLSSSEGKFFYAASAKPDVIDHEIAKIKVARVKSIW